MLFVSLPLAVFAYIIIYVYISVLYNNFIYIYTGCPVVLVLATTAYDAIDHYTTAAGRVGRDDSVV